MHIGIDARMMGTGNAGIGRYIFEIVSRVIPQDPINTYTVFFNQKTSFAKDVEAIRKFPNARLIPCNIRHYSVGEQTSFLWKLNKLNFDLVHFPNFNVPIWYEKPFITTIHDVVHHKIGGHKKSHLLHFYAYKKTIEYAAKESRAIITVSEHSKKDITGIFQVPAEKVKVIYEGTSLRNGATEDNITRVKRHFLLSRPYLLFVGTLERKKNIVSLTRGFDVLIQKYKCDADLVIAGKIDRHYPEVKHKAMDIKANDRLVFTGYVEDEELAALYKGAYAFASASMHEGFGLPGVEAMKFGLPLLVSNIDVFNEIYDNAAIYFKPEDTKDIAEKMYLLLKDEQFRAQLSQNSLKRAELFDWNKAANETLEVYRRCLNDQSTNSY